MRLPRVKDPTSSRIFSRGSRRRNGLCSTLLSPYSFSLFSDLCSLLSAFLSLSLSLYALPPPPLPLLLPLPLPHLILTSHCYYLFLYIFYSALTLSFFTSCAIFLFFLYSLYIMCITLFHTSPLFLNPFLIFVFYLSPP